MLTGRLPLTMRIRSKWSKFSASKISIIYALLRLIVNIPFALTSFHLCPEMKFATVFEVWERLTISDAVGNINVDCFFYFFFFFLLNSDIQVVLLTSFIRSPWQSFKENWENHGRLYLLLMDQHQLPIGQQATFRMDCFIASDCTLDSIIYALIICYFLLVCGLGLFGGVLCSVHLLLLVNAVRP